jgi:aspartyl-tRNA(Asn)/glutamyl-tRNA(Gln) amidotransferase subunit A
VLVGLGAEVREVTIPYPDQVLAAEWGIVMPEAAAYHEESLRTKADLFRPDTRVKLEVGAMILATDYIKALRVRTLMQRAWAALFDAVDVVVAPVQPFPAPLVDEMEVTWPDGSTEPVDLAMVRLTSPANLTGLPTLALPTGFDATGLPLGMQLTGRPFDEATLLNLGVAYEAATDVVGRLAPL